MAGNLIILTGASGFIGKNFKSKLENVIELDQHNCWEFLNTFDKWDQVSLILHQGAISSTTETDISKIHKWNVEYTLQLFEYAINKHNIDRDIVNFIAMIKIIGYSLFQNSEDFLNLLKSCGYNSMNLESFNNRYYDILNLLKYNLNTCCYLDYLGITNDVFVTNKYDNLWLLTLFFLSGDCHYDIVDKHQLMVSLYQINKKIKITTSIGQDVLYECLRLYNSTNQSFVIDSLSYLTDYISI